MRIRSPYVDPPRRACRLRTGARRDRRVVGRKADGSDAAQALLRPFPRHVVRGRGRRRLARRVPLWLPLADVSDEAYIHFVGVDPARRTTGLGRTLYERFFAAVADRSVVRAVTSP